MPRTFAQLAGRQRWLDPASGALNRVIEQALSVAGPSRDTIRAWMHGEPLGHPLHATLTDLPLGAWTTALVFDALAARSDDDAWSTAARGAIGVGMVGAVAAAATGLADWHQLHSRETRRIGLIHGLLNLGGLAAFSLSFVRRRRPGHGHRSALAGYALAITAAQLGSALVYQHGAGQRRPAEAPQTARPAA